VHCFIVFEGLGVVLCRAYSFEGNHAIHVCICSDVLLLRESRAEIDGKSQDRRGNFVSQHQRTGNQKKKKKECQEALHLLN
jgi:hypothetical protein